MNRLTLISIIVTIGVLSRTVFHINNNIEFITALTLATAYFVKDIKVSVLSTLGILLISDLIIGNTNIFLFTWSGFLLMVLVGKALKSSNIKSRFVASETGAIISTLLFFFWTNFGVVVTTSMYSKDISGLIQSYQNGLPFLLNQLIGNLIIVPVVFFAFDYLLNKRDKFDLKSYNKI